MEVTLYLIRHATAGVRDSHNPRDDQRQLDEYGHNQAQAIADRLGGEPILGIFSSPAIRCVQTVEPLAARLGLRVSIAPELFEGASSSRSIEYLRSFVGQSVVLCSHGDVIPDMLRILEVGGTRLTGRGCAKGSIWALENSTEQVARADYFCTPESPAAAS